MRLRFNLHLKIIFASNKFPPVAACVAEDKSLHSEDNTAQRYSNDEEAKGESEVVHGQRLRVVFLFRWQENLQSV